LNFQALFFVSFASKQKKKLNKTQIVILLKEVNKHRQLKTKTHFFLSQLVNHL
jgi:hypothetical protein